MNDHRFAMLAKNNNVPVETVRRCYEIYRENRKLMKIEQAKPRITEEEMKEMERIRYNYLHQHETPDLDLSYEQRRNIFYTIVLLREIFI